MVNLTKENVHYISDKCIIVDSLRLERTVLYLRKDLNPYTDNGLQNVLTELGFFIDGRDEHDGNIYFTLRRCDEIQVNDIRA